VLIGMLILSGGGGGGGIAGARGRMQGSETGSVAAGWAMAERSRILAGLELEVESQAGEFRAGLGCVWGRRPGDGRGRLRGPARSYGPHGGGSRAKVQ